MASGLYIKTRSAFLPPRGPVKICARNGREVLKSVLEDASDTDDEEVCGSVSVKAAVIGYTRMLRRAIRRPEAAESIAKIARSKEVLAMLLEKIGDVCFDG